MTAVSIPLFQLLHVHQKSYLHSVNGHVESRWTVETGQWSEPIFVPDPYLRIHGLSPALNYGQQAYEGLKGTTHPPQSPLDAPPPLILND